MISHFEKVSKSASHINPNTSKKIIRLVCHTLKTATCAINTKMKENGRLINTGSKLTLIFVKGQNFMGLLQTSCPLVVLVALTRILHQGIFES